MMFMGIMQIGLLFVEILQSKVMDIQLGEIILNSAKLKTFDVKHYG